MKRINDHVFNHNETPCSHSRRLLYVMNVQRDETGNLAGRFGDEYRAIGAYDKVFDGGARGPRFIRFSKDVRKALVVQMLDALPQCRQTLVVGNGR
jgi:hypothetical protein